MELQNTKNRNYDLEIHWNYKHLAVPSMFLFIFLFTSIFFILNGCAQKPKVIIKHDYIEKPIPKMQTIPIKDLNLSKSKSLKLHIKIISK